MNIHLPTQAISCCRSVQGLGSTAGELLERWPVESPFQVVVAVRQTRGMVLCNFGTGWAEPDYGFGSDPFVCSGSGLLRLAELAAWTDQDGVQTFAFDAGLWLEDAFGLRHRRYLAHRGALRGRVRPGAVPMVACASSIPLDPHEPNRSKPHVLWTKGELFDNPWAPGSGRALVSHSAFCREENLE